MYLIIIRNLLCCWGYLAVAGKQIRKSWSGLNLIGSFGWTLWRPSFSNRLASCSCGIFIQFPVILSSFPIFLENRDEDEILVTDVMY
ncbi:MAG: hypothetical protein QXP01_02015, partial [Candidatus Hadarchaeum sp.]